MAANLSIVTRARWGAEPALGKETLKHPVPHVKIISVDNSDPCSTEDECMKQMKKIQHHDMFDKQQTDIIPNFLIGDDGKIYEGRGWFSKPPDSFVPAHFSGKFILIGHIGGRSDVMPSKKFLECKNELVQFGVKRKFITDPHSMI